MNFKELLKSKKMSQQQLADELKISQQTISNWCTGYREPKIRSLIKMSKLFLITIDEIVECLQNTKKGEKTKC